MPEILTNTSPLIALDNIGKLGVLEAMYGVMHCTEEVACEFGPQLPAWVRVHRVQDRTRVAILGNLVDPGEASVIALAFEMPDSLLILDDRKGRQLAANLQLHLTGLVGVLVQARRRGIIASLGAELAALRSAGFRVSQTIEVKAMHLAGEARESDDA